MRDAKLGLVGEKQMPDEMKIDQVVSEYGGHSVREWFGCVNRELA